MLARFMLWAAVCPSQVGVLLNIGSCKHNHTITQGRTLVRNSVREIRPGTSMWYRPLLRIRTERAVIVDGPKVSPSNPRWWTAAILKKTVKSPYLCNRLTDLDIWHGDAYWPISADRPFKFRIFENPRWRAVTANLNLTKSRYIRSSLTDLYEIW